MLGNFRAIFNPTPEDMERKRKHYREVVKHSYDEKWCHTCVNSEQVEIQEHGRPTVITECKICDYWKMKSGCKDYVSDGKMNELLYKLDE